MMTADPVELVVETALEKAGIPFQRNALMGHRTIDFWLSEHDVFIEVCRCWTPRKIEQLEGLQNVILIQGLEAAQGFAAMISAEAQ